MPNEQSTISTAEDDALDHQILLSRIAADGVITIDELRQLKRSAERVHRSVRKAHRDQRRAISIIRTGKVAVGVIREFGPDEDWAA